MLPHYEHPEHTRLFHVLKIILPRSGISFPFLLVANTLSDPIPSLPLWNCGGFVLGHLR